MIYMHITAIIMSLLICYKWGDWRHWNKYYSTIQFFIIGDLMYNVLFNNTMLWRYVCPSLNHTLINLFIMITVYPSTILVFIPHYPKGVINQVIYIFSWTVLYVVVEYISCVLGSFKHDNGWNIVWSSIFCIIMFPLIYLHYRRPLFAWLFTIIEAIIFIVIFQVDILGLV